MTKTFGAPFTKKGARAKGGPDKRVFTEEGAAKRKHALMHNQLRGYAVLIQKNAYAIGMRNSTTIEAKKLAAQIHNLAVKLSEELKTRIDPD